MNRYPLLIFLLILAMLLVVSFNVFALDQYQNRKNYFNQNQFTKYNFDADQNYNNTNYNNLKEDRKLALINQKGKFNQADIWQEGKTGFNSALIVQIGNENQASIRQLVGNNKALVKQYGFNNKTNIVQVSSYNNLKVSQFGNNDILEIKQN